MKSLIILFINLIDCTLNIKTVYSIQKITSKNSKFGSKIEGTAVNKKGEIFVVNYNNKDNELGQIYPIQRFFFKGYDNSKFNSIRFFNETVAFTIDYANHIVFKIILNNKGRVIKYLKFCYNDKMLQPNDLTISDNGYIYLSGMRFSTNTKKGDGDLWMCKPNGGKSILISNNFGRTNGIELSPDNKILYLSESYDMKNKAFNQTIWKININNNIPDVKNKKLFVNFNKLNTIEGKYDIDGMKVDTMGKLYVTRNGNGKIYRFNSKSELKKVVQLNIEYPTNLEFGGEDGNTLFIVGRCKDNKNKGCMDSITYSNETRGNTWSKLNKN